MDIIIPTIRDLSFLEKWRPFFEKHHLIIIKDGDPDVKVTVPEGFDYEMYDRRDIEKELGDKAWAISFKDSACRCFGFLKSKSKYVFTIDDDCLPAKDSYGNLIDPIKQHLENLESPCFPDYFNTLYDGEFVRGYPFELRKGKPTVISHGLWLNVPDLDAPTQMVKPHYKNEKQQDLVISIPKEVPYSMCGMNLAFDRELIGPAMYFGLMGDGQPIGRYDDMWAGWSSKVILDHLGMGVKSGKPYIWHTRASNWTSNFKKEFKGIIWQEEIMKFFKNVKFSPDAKDALSCYRELAEQVDLNLSKVDPYFKKLSEGMKIWCDLWEQKNKKNQEFIAVKNQ